MIRKVLSRLGRLFLSEKRYQAIREKILGHFRVDSETKYKRIRATFFKKTRKREEYHNVYRSRLNHLVHVDQPMVLISQAARSGGTMLHRLFDSHPECHTYPVELAMGIKPDIYDYPWPEINLNDTPETWLKSLVQIHVWRWLKNDFRYWPQDKETYPFIFCPLLCEKIFNTCVVDLRHSAINQRNIFNSYMTAFFNAWVDNQNLYSPSLKKFTVAFAPQMVLEKENIRKFFGVYPDGKFISVIRDPFSWYASASRYRPKIYGEIESSIQNYWKKSTNNAIELWREHKERVILIRFDSLVQNTEGVMEGLAGKLGIEFTNSMLDPTFNNHSIKANSSFNEKKNLKKQTINRYKEILSQDEIRRIDLLSTELYDKALKVSEAF
ncbi:MAG: sulfotransferase [Desulfobacterales bacterium]|nr:sulfotransferase [Desulfobacterales bacterium]